MSFLNYLHENHAVIETETLTENYIIDEFDDIEELFESIKSFKDIPAGLKKIFVNAYKKAGEASSVKELSIESESRITTKGALDKALKAAFSDAGKVSGFIITADDKAVLGLIMNLNAKYNVLSLDGTVKEDGENLNTVGAIKAIKAHLDADIEGGLSAALKGKGIEIKVVHVDKERETKESERADNKPVSKRYTGSELTADERSAVITKFAKQHINKHVEELLKELPTLQNIDTLLKASLEHDGHEIKNISSIATKLRDLSNALNAYRWASEDNRIRDFKGNVATYLKRIKKGD